jgi:hypothetical protein
MPTALQRQIERVTGAGRTIRQQQGRGRGSRDVNMDKRERGTRFGFGNTTQLREDLVAAFGGD